MPTMLLFCSFNGIIENVNYRKVNSKVSMQAQHHSCSQALKHWTYIFPFYVTKIFIFSPLYSIKCVPSKRKLFHLPVYLCTQGETPVFSVCVRPSMYIQVHPNGIFLDGTRFIKYTGENKYLCQMKRKQPRPSGRVPVSQYSVDDPSTLTAVFHILIVFVICEHDFYTF